MRDDGAYCRENATVEGGVGGDVGSTVVVDLELQSDLDDVERCDDEALGVGWLAVSV